MSDRYFLDTNILVYTFDTRQPAKKDAATHLVRQALASGDGVISFQVVQEFLNVAGRKFERPLTPSHLAMYLNSILGPLCHVFPTLEMYADALQLGERYGYSFYDSLIVAAALRANCRTLYSEDLQHGQEIRTLKVVNPFL